MEYKVKDTWVYLAVCGSIKYRWEMEYKVRDTWVYLAAGGNIYQ